MHSFGKRREIILQLLEKLSFIETNAYKKIVHITAFRTQTQKLAKHDAVRNRKIKILLISQVIFAK